jgi:sigma-B regulation protein RsbU (phosphoserine phosphatase)
MAPRVTPRPGAAPPPTARDQLLHTWPGRLFLFAAALKLLFTAWRLAGTVPAAALVVNSLATLALAIAVFVFAWRLFVQIKRRLLWRVRRKLILSYIFIGVIPSLLILVFFLFAGSLVFMNVSAYLFKDGYDQIVEHARLSAQAAATEIARNPASAAETIARVHRIRASMYPALSVAYLGPGGGRETIGPWQGLGQPEAVPAWLNGKEEVFAETFGVPVKDAPGEEDLIVRAVVKVGARGANGAVVVDIPLDEGVMHKLHDTTGVRLENVFDSRIVSSSTARTTTTSGQRSRSMLFEKSLSQIDVYEWMSGKFHKDTVALTYRVGALYKQLSRAQSLLVGNGGMRLSDALLWVLVIIGVMFLIIEAAALIMGLALARSITSSVHELFMGTERVRQGDFGHRINIESKDQLGELAESFNQMTGSIENLLLTAAEKKRMEEELRIARQIQMSLLPRGPLDFPGISMTALCVPAREVGGDYYDFFHVGDRQLGVLIADVSGKGTSAALYMAELKGLMLSLSQIYTSPRQLLMEVNRIISENLDTRSFITMTYGVIDLSKGVMTFARAGHTPLVYLRGDRGAASAQILAPSGIVVGLRIPGATEKFAELLEEDRIELHKGDVLVFYTDGITEAMDAASDLFGDARLSRLISEHGHLDTADLRERILREIESFVGDAHQHDDMTMLLIKIEAPVVVPQQVAV